MWRQSRRFRTIAAAVAMVGACSVPTAAEAVQQDGPMVVVTPDTDLRGGQSVQVDFTGFTQAGFHTLGQCRSSAVNPIVDPTSNCRLINTYEAFPPTTTADVQTLFTSYNGSSTIDCRAEPCSLAAATFVSIGDLTVLESAAAPISFGPPPTLSLDPSQNLLDGTAMAWSATGLIPDDPNYQITICDVPAGWCNYETGVETSSPDGSAAGTIEALRRFTLAPPGQGPVYLCRQECTVRLSHYNGEDVSAGFTMSEGDISVSPTSGLADGDEVTVSGSALQPSYVGLAFGPFESGRWATAQCEAAVGSNPTLFDTFVHCGFTEGLSVVDVPGSVLEPTSLPVAATMTKILGGETDCAAAPGACVFGLFRFEEDGSVSALHVPLVFGAG